MDVEFNSLRELYLRLEPALETKRSEMERAGYQYIKKEDIWNYLKEVKWKNSKNLLLNDMVDDILNSDELDIDEHLKRQMRRETRTARFDEE